MVNKDNLIRKFSHQTLIPRILFKEPGRKIYGVALPSENEESEEDDDVEFIFEIFYFEETFLDLFFKKD